MSALVECKGLDVAYGPVPQQPRNYFTTFGAAKLRFEDFKDGVSNTILVGRSRACDVALSDASVSKIHARVALARGRATTVEMSDRLHVKRAFGFHRNVKAPVTAAPAFAFAGIAKPDRFFVDLEASGWKLSGRRSFPRSMACFT